MTWDNKVAWTEGMFLRSQHLQQQDRYAEMLVRTGVEAVEAYAWGVSSFTLDQAALTQGRLAIAEADGRFPDGTPFSIPETADAPLPVDLDREVRDCLVYLAIPTRRANAYEVGAADVAPGAARYRREESDVRDVTGAPTATAQMEVARPLVRLLLATQETRDHALIPIARVVEVREDRQVLLDDRFIPSCTRFGASRALAGFMSELEGMVTQRADALASRVSGSGQRGVAEVADFMMLQALNRVAPVIAHVNEAKLDHPRTLFRDLGALAGELATFVARSRRPPALPAYTHHDLQTCFRPLMQMLRQALSVVMEQTAIPIALQQRNYGVRVGIIPDRSLVAKAAFVLAAKADVAPEVLRAQLPGQTKVGSVERIRELVNSAVPGIALKPLSVAPRQIPYHAGKTYFELDRSSDLWRELAKSGGLAIHVSDSFPGLELECWAIRA